MNMNFQYPNNVADKMKKNVPIFNFSENEKIQQC